VFIDPGHGGPVPATALYGSPAGRKARETESEKDINLGVAARVCSALGDSAVLSRSGDYDVPLRQRIERARAAHAAAFVSIHSNTGRTDHGRPEVWVFEDGTVRAGRSSHQLAERIRAELTASERVPVALRRGNLALLRPELHGESVAAVLVETGSLRNAAGRARLADQRTRERIGDAVARGVTRYIDEDFRSR
jgi:N-acetylmuramoyl-L-alanine amidase